MSECSPPAAARGWMGTDCMAHENISWENGDANLCSQRRMANCEADLICHLYLGNVVIPQKCSTNAVGRFLGDAAD